MGAHGGAWGWEASLTLAFMVQCRLCLLLWICWRCGLQNERATTGLTYTRPSLLRNNPLFLPPSLESPLPLPLPLPHLSRASRQKKREKESEGGKVAPKSGRRQSGPDFDFSVFFFPKPNFNIADNSSRASRTQSQSTSPPLPCSLDGGSRGSPDKFRPSHPHPLGIPPTSLVSARSVAARGTTRERIQGHTRDRSR